MPGRSDNADDAQSKSSVRFWEQPLPAKIAGLSILIGAALLLLGGAYRDQPSLTRSGLMFLAMGAVFLPGAFRRTLSMQVAFYALAIIGVFYAVTT
jgi:hypothetical protein